MKEYIFIANCATYSNYVPFDFYEGSYSPYDTLP